MYGAQEIYRDLNITISGVICPMINPEADITIKFKNMPRTFKYRKAGHLKTLLVNYSIWQVSPWRDPTFIHYHIDFLMRAVGNASTLVLVFEKSEGFHVHLTRQAAKAMLENLENVSIT